MDNTELELRVYDYDTDDYKKALILRYNILSLSKGVDSSGLKFIYGAHDDERDHIKCGAFIGDAIVGTLNLAKQNDGSLLLRQFAVESKLQGMGIGIKLIKFAHEKAAELGYKKIYLHSRMNVLGFYSKAGYVMTGKLFVYPKITLAEMYAEI